MADQTLEEALLGLYTQPAGTPYGLAAMSLAQTAPKLINPYGSWQSNLAVGLGSILAASLLGYQAKQDAMEENAALQPLITKALQTQSLGDIDALLATPEGQMLGPVGTKLKMSLLEKQAEQATQQRKLSDAVMLQMIEQGYLPESMQKLYPDYDAGELTPLEQKQIRIEGLKAQARESAKPKPEPKPEKDWYEKLPSGQKQKLTAATGLVNKLDELAAKFDSLQMSAPEYQLKAIIPGSEANLAYAQALSLLPQMSRLMGEMGNLSQQEQVRQLESTLGSFLSGSTSIAARMKQLADTGRDIMIGQIETARTGLTKGGDVLLQELKRQPAPVTPQMDQEIAELRSIASDPQASASTKAMALERINQLLGE